MSPQEAFMWRPNEESPDLAGLAHDLNNVFETIAEAAELLSDEKHSQPLAAAIARSVERGRRLVDGLADQHLAPIDLAVVVDRAADFVRDLTGLLGRPEVCVLRQFDPGLHLRGPGSEWERVFMNLFLNAAQAMPAGGVITVHALSQSGGHEIHVADEGPGISAEILPRIFEPNFSTRRQHPGLGLHIVDTIVRRHGGAIRAANRSTRSGARFSILLPATQTPV